MSDQNNWDFDDLIAQIERKYISEGLKDCWQGEKAAVEEAVRCIAEDISTQRYTPREALGVGGSGIVIRLEDKLFTKRDKALKFPRPVEGKIQLLADMLRNEITYLADLRHQGIVRIAYYATIEPVDSYYGSLPFYLMEYISGARSIDFMRNENTTEEDLHKIVCQTAETLAYLHEGEANRFVHLDIKHENIMITESGRAVMIDLGTCKRLKDTSGSTIVAVTRPNAHPELVRLLIKDPSDENRSRGEVPRELIKPGWDLWALGLTILDWFGLDREDGSVLENSIYSRLSPYTRKFYLLLIVRLLNAGARHWHHELVGLQHEMIKEFPVRTANELCDVLSRLRGGGPLDAIEELSEASSGSIQAAEYRHVPFTDALSSVFTHRLFRRLNNISQLGLVSQVYPGAKNTRREHSIGTYASVGRFLRSLYNDSYSPLFRQIITEEDCRAVLLAALLHDIGQFPMAHDLEEIDNLVFNHSDLNHAMLKGKWERKRKGSKAIAFDSLSDVFDKWKVTQERVASILTAKPMATGASRIDKLLRSLLSGPIDADKLDYLLRDASHTNVPYPKGIDVDRLQRCLTTIVIQEAGAHNIPMIGIHSKGKAAAEFLVLARYAMFSQVYWHHAVRAQKAMLQRAICALLARLSQGEVLEGFKAKFIQMVTTLPEILYTEQTELPFPKEVGEQELDITPLGTGTDLFPTDAAVLTWFREQLIRSGAPESILIDGILRRKLFKRLWVIGYDMDTKRWERITEYWDQFDRIKRVEAALEFEHIVVDKLTPEKAISVTSLKATNVQGIIEEKTAGKIPWLLIDVPGKRPGSDVGLYYVLEGQRRQLRKNDKAVGEVKCSVLWEKYAQDLRQVAGKIRIFCDEHLVDTIEASIPFEEGLDALEEALKRTAS